MGYNVLAVDSSAHPLQHMKCSPVVWFFSSKPRLPMTVTCVDMLVLADARAPNMASVSGACCDVRWLGPLVVTLENCSSSQDIMLLELKQARPMLVCRRPSPTPATNIFQNCQGSQAQGKALMWL